MDTQKEEVVGVAASGEALRQAREARGLRPADVAQMLKLSTRQIEAIENEQFDQLPGTTWLRGFVRNYARFLDLDPAPLLERLVQAPVKAENLRLTPDSNAMGVVRSSPNGYRPQSALPALAAVAVLVVGGLLAWHFDLAARLERKTPGASAVSAVGSSEPAFPPATEETRVVMAQVDSGVSMPVASGLPEPTASQPVVAASAARASSASTTVIAVAASTPIAAVSSSAPDASAAGPEIMLGFERDAWVEVRDASGKTIFSRLGKAGESQEVRGTPPFALVVGNAPHVKLQYRGKVVALEPKGGTDVVRLSLP